MCEKKRRWTIKDEKYVKLGYMAFERFRELNHMKKPDYQEFVDSRFFVAFCKFGRYIINMNAIEPREFIEFVLKTGVPLDSWCSGAVYEQFVRRQTSKEPAGTALERNIHLMVQWGIEHNEEWFNFFRKVSPNLATQLIKNGRLSPWVLYNCESAEVLFDKFSEEQINIISSYITPGVWKRKFIHNKDDVEFIHKISKEAGF